MLRIYITSAVHNEGKTFIATGLAVTLQSLGYSTVVYKPVQASGKEVNGFMQSPELTYIKTLDPYIDTRFSYLFKSSGEPLAAASDEGQFIDIDLINNDYKKYIENSDCCIMDGEGSILSPLAPSVQNIDMINKLQVPVLYAAKPDENTISRILPSIYCALEKGVDVRGVVINNIPNDCSKKLLTTITGVIEEYSGVNVLGLIPTLANISAPEEIITSILNGVDVESVFGVRLEKLEFNS